MKPFSCLHVRRGSSCVLHPAACKKFSKRMERGEVGIEWARKFHNVEEFSGRYAVLGCVNDFLAFLNYDFRGD